MTESESVALPLGDAALYVNRESFVLTAKSSNSLGTHIILPKTFVFVNRFFIFFLKNFTFYKEIKSMSYPVTFFVNNNLFLLQN